MNDKVKFALYLPPEKKAELERRYRENGCKSLTAFIEKAIDFYLGYLDANGTGTFLPKEIQSAIDGRLGMFEDRMAKLLYKLTVEMDMGMSAALECIQMDDGYLRKLRSDSVRNVKSTNGLLTFEQKFKAQADDADGDDQWQNRLSRVPTSRAAVLADMQSTSPPAMAWNCCPPATWSTWQSVLAPTVSSVMRTTWI